MITLANVRWRRCLLGAMTVLVAACTNTPAVDDPPDQPQAESQAVQAAKAEEAERERLRQSRQEFKQRLITQADQALADRRLTLPEHDNAYDRYNTVLLLDPGNERAVGGLQSIVLAYADLIRSALRRGQMQEALQLIERAETYYPDNPLLNDLRNDVAQARQEAERQKEQRQEAGSGRPQEIALPQADLSRRTEAVSEILAQIGQRVQKTDEQVLIIARTDAEGRWIYKQINDAVPEYRIRGNIQLGSPARLQLLSPI